MKGAEKRLYQSLAQKRACKYAKRMSKRVLKVTSKHYRLARTKDGGGQKSILGILRSLEEVKATQLAGMKEMQATISEGPHREPQYQDVDSASPDDFALALKFTGATVQIEEEDSSDQDTGEDDFSTLFQTSCTQWLKKEDAPNLLQRASIFAMELDYEAKFDTALVYNHIISGLQPEAGIHVIIRKTDQGDTGSILTFLLAHLSTSQLCPAVVSPSEL